MRYSYFFLSLIILTFNSSAEKMLPRDCAIELYEALDYVLENKETEALIFSKMLQKNAELSLDVSSTLSYLRQNSTVADVNVYCGSNRSKLNAITIIQETILVLEIYFVFDEVWKVEMASLHNNDRIFKDYVNLLKHTTGIDPLKTIR